MLHGETLFNKIYNLITLHDDHKLLNTLCEIKNT